MKSAKWLSVLLTLSVMTAGLFASGKTEVQPVRTAATAGLSDGAITALSLREKPIKYEYVIKTKYFDILYPAQSEITARILASCVDALYEKAASEFETDPWMHFPIIIQPSTQIFNAYYTPQPYNHIMLLDTPNTGATLAVEAETVVNTFYHELVHAVTTNIHKNSKNNRPNLLGDLYSMQFVLNSKLFFIEGATVSLESRGGEGRVNSGESMSMLIQAKLEDKFPGWRDISGPRDIYPSSTASYLFGGAFNAWLQNEYGMSRYADFWKECSTAHITGFTGIFKNVYGMSLDDAWELFSQTVPVPETEAEDKRTTLDEEARFASLAARPGAESGIVYTRDAGAVWYHSLSDPGAVKERKLFTCFGSPNQLSFSGDGRFLAVSGYMTGTDDAYSIRIFDMESGLFCGAEIPYSRNAVITEGADGRHYLFCIESAASYQFVSQYLLDDVLNAGSSVPEPLSRMELDVFDELYDTTPVSGGAACLRKTNGVWYLSVMSTEGTVTDWRFPENAVPSGLVSVESNSSEYTFYTAITSRSMNAGSETEPGALARLGVITVHQGEAALSYQKKAFSGGTHSPAVTRQGTVFSIARLYGKDTLCSFRFDETDMTAPVAMVCEVPVQSESGRSAANTPYSAEKYKPLSYMGRGLFIPVPGINTSPFNSPVTQGGLGFTWLTATPTGAVNFALSAGTTPSFDIDDPDGEVTFEPTELYASLFGETSRLSGGTFMWDVDGLISLDKDFAVEELCARFVFGGKLPLSDSGETLTLINGTSFYDWTNSAAVFRGDRNALRYGIIDNVSAEYSLTRKKGISSEALSGINLGARFYFQYLVLNSCTPDMKTSTSNHLVQKYDEKTYGGIGVFGGFRLARLLPLPFHSTLTYNLPLTVSASLFNTPRDLLQADASVTLFSVEIQKGVPYVPFYCNRFSVNAGWSFRNGTPSGYSFNPYSIFNCKDIMHDFNRYPSVHALTGGLNFVMAPDIGMLRNMNFNLGINGAYYLHNDASDKKYEISILGIWNF